MFKTRTFEESISPYSLKFHQPALEKIFLESRLKFLRLPPITKYLIWGIAGFFATMLIADIIRLIIERASTEYIYIRSLAFGLLTGGIVLELLAWKCRHFALFRSVPTHLLCSFMAIYSSFSDYADTFPFPVIDMWYPSFPTKIKNRGLMIFICVFVVQVSISLTWITCAVSHVIVMVMASGLYLGYYTKSLLDRKGGLSFGIMTGLYLAYMLIIGFVSTLFCYISEIREKKNIFDECQITETKDMYKSLLNALPEPVIIAAEGEVKLWNNALLNLISVPLDTDSFNPSTLRQFKQRNGEQTLEQLIIKEDTVSPKNRNNEYVFQNGNTNLKLTVKSVEIAHDKGKLVEHIIEDHTAVEELEKARAEKKCFYILLSTAAHDFRTPLNGLHGLLEIISPQLETLPCFSELQLAQTCIQRMLLYLQGLSFLNRIVAGDLRINQDETDVRGMVKETVGLMEYSAKSKNLAIEEAYMDVPDILVFDKEKYQQILVNLMENAVKYTFRGSIKIHVSYNLTEEMLETSVADQGVGIAKEDMKDLFKLFRKTYKTEALNPQGIGIGLYLTKKLSKRLGGKISVDSDKSQGTKVTFTIRAKIAGSIHREESSSLEIGSHLFKLEDIEELKGSITIPTMRNSTMPSQRRQTKTSCDCSKALIVDDEALNIYVLQQYLKSVGIPSDTAINGEEALKRILAKHCLKCGTGYDIVLMDINMPIMDGIECTRAIQQLVAKGTIRETSIFAVTAAAHLENAQVFAEYQTIGFTAICMIFFFD